MTERERRVYALRHEHKSNAEIQATLRISAHTLNRAVTKLRALHLPLPHSRSLPSDKAEILRRLWGERVAVTEIGRVLGMPDYTVRTHARTLHLPNRREARSILALLGQKEKSWLYAQLEGGLTMSEIIAAIVRDAYLEERGK